MKKKQYTVLDLFCGCGGLSKGFEMAGYKILLGVDFNEPALKTYAHNHKGSKTLCGDLSAPDTFDKINSLIGNQTIDVIIGGPLADYLLGYVRSQVRVHTGTAPVF